MKENRKPPAPPAQPKEDQRDERFDWGEGDFEIEEPAKRPHKPQPEEKPQLGSASS